MNAYADLTRHSVKFLVNSGHLRVVYICTCCVMTTKQQLEELSDL